MKYLRLQYLIHNQSSQWTLQSLYWPPWIGLRASSTAVPTTDAHPDEDPPRAEQRDTAVQEVVGLFVCNDDSLR